MMEFKQYKEDATLQRLIPEVADGFIYNQMQEYHSLTLDNTFLKYRYPHSVFAEAERGVIYKVEVLVKALSKLEQAFLFTGRKQLRDVISLDKGESNRGTYYQTVTEIIPDFQTESYEASHLFVTVCAKHGEEVATECQATKTIAPVLFLGGDSTVTDQAAPLPYLPGVSYTSYGQSITAYLTNPIAVENHAHSGLTTETFIQSGHWDLVMKWIKEEDFCLLQFGHNDQKQAHLMAGTGYRENLQRFVTWVKEKGARPVLVTPFGRNTWNRDGSYNDLLSEYNEAVLELGVENNVPVIPLHQRSIEFYKRIGCEAAKAYFMPDDYTHTNEFGSYLAAGWVADELSKFFPEEIIIRPNVPILEPGVTSWNDYTSGTRVTSVNEDGESAGFHQMETAIEDLVRTIEQVKVEAQNL